MPNAARERIFDQLNSALARGTRPVPAVEAPLAPHLDRKAKITQLKALMEAVRTEVHVVQKADWITVLGEILRQKGVQTLLYAPETPLGAAMDAAWEDASDSLPALKVYPANVEAFKAQLFEIDAGITTAAGAVADTGALILAPDEKEPRLVSLVPPIHVAVLDADTIYDSLADALTQQGWSRKMPTNLLLISGPSKTADIEFQLVFGVHGPKELVVLIRN